MQGGVIDVGCSRLNAAVHTGLTDASEDKIHAVKNYVVGGN
jgi:hypothetical protein